MQNTEQPTVTLVAGCPRCMKELHKATKRWQAAIKRAEKRKAKHGEGPYDLAGIDIAHRIALGAAIDAWHCACGGCAR